MTFMVDIIFKLMWTYFLLNNFIYAIFLSFKRELYKNYKFWYKEEYNKLFYQNSTWIFFQINIFI